jgi:hypothetical protein
MPSFDPPTVCSRAGEVRRREGCWDGAWRYLRLVSLPGSATGSIMLSAGSSVSVCRLSTTTDRGRAGSTVLALIRALNSSVEPLDGFRRLCRLRQHRGQQRECEQAFPASARQSAAARHFSRHLCSTGRRRCLIYFGAVAWNMLNRSAETSSCCGWTCGPGRCGASGPVHCCAGIASYGETSLQPGQANDDGECRRSRAA